jgi:hypothetical protein
VDDKAQAQADLLHGVLELADALGIQDKILQQGVTPTMSEFRPGWRSARHSAAPRAWSATGTADCT